LGVLPGCELAVDAAQLAAQRAAKGLLRVSVSRFAGW
jgi:hypothetical protein